MHKTHGSPTSSCLRSLWQCSLW